MVNVSISKELALKVPKIKLSCIESEVNVIENDEVLWSLIQQQMNEITSKLQISEISNIPAIEASRRAYKACGKDPARYRLSAEALLRRVLKKKELYQVNNVVDLLNLISISTGYSIGGYDADKIIGNATFGVGKENEPYVGIGRGELNIEFLPVFRDEVGAFGTPTSDSVRTSVSLQTKRFLMVIIDYGGGELENATSMATKLLKTYAGASNFEFNTISG